MDHAIKNKIPMETRVREYLTYLVRHVRDHGFQPNTHEAAAHFGVDPSVVRVWILDLAARGAITLPPGKAERCLGLNLIRFRHGPGPHLPDWPAEFQALAEIQQSLRENEESPE